MLYLENLKESDKIWRPERRLEVNIKIECQGVKLIYLAHCRAFLSKVINLPVLQNVGSFLDQLSILNFSKESCNLRYVHVGYLDRVTTTQRLERSQFGVTSPLHLDLAWRSRCVRAASSQISDVEQELLIVDIQIGCTAIK